MSSDPDPPTRRLPPQQPAAQVRESEYAAGVSPQEAALRDRLRSLQTALTLVGLLAAVALGVALWTLLSEKEETDRRGASPERVSRLQERVSALEDRVDDRATKNSVAGLRDDIDSLQADLGDATAQDGDEAQQAVETLQADVDELRAQVDDLVQQAAAQEQDQP